MTSSRPKVIPTLWRGLRKRCPHCGEGHLYAGWSELQRCSSCGLVFVPKPGDTWFFTIIGDRLPLVLFGLTLSLVTALLVGYVVTNLGTLWRLRSLIAVPLWILVIALAPRAESAREQEMKREQAIGG